jgi:hypothetical protein
MGAKGAIPRRSRRASRTSGCTGSADATVASFLWQAQGYPVDNLPKRAASTPELLAYVDGVRRRYWPEYAAR